MFQTNNYSFPIDTWNFPPAYYPGSNYVDWLGLSVYGQQFNAEPWADFLSLVDWPYQEIARLDPRKPILIAEWATGEFPNSGDKAKWIREAFAVLKTKCPRVKAEVYWHERWQNLDQSYNLHINSSPEALAAYRRAVADPYWLGDLILRPASREPTRLRLTRVQKIQCQFPLPGAVFAPDPEIITGRRRGVFTPGKSQITAV